MGILRVCFPELLAKFDLLLGLFCKKECVVGEGIPGADYSASSWWFQGRINPNQEHTLKFPDGSFCQGTYLEVKACLESKGFAVHTTSGNERVYICPCVPGLVSGDGERECVPHVEIEGFEGCGAAGGDGGECASGISTVGCYDKTISGTLTAILAAITAMTASLLAALEALLNKPCCPQTRCVCLDIDGEIISGNMVVLVSPEGTEVLRIEDAQGNTLEGTVVSCCAEAEGTIKEGKGTSLIKVVGDFGGLSTINVVDAGGEVAVKEVTSATFSAATKTTQLQLASATLQTAKFVKRVAKKG